MSSNCERGIPVRLSYSAVLVAAMMGVWRHWRTRTAGEVTCEFAGRIGRLWQDAVIGALGECALTTHLGFRWTPRLGSDSDSGDVCGCQVKTTDCTDGHLIIPASDDLKRLFVLVVGDGFRLWRIVGWLDGREIANHPEWVSFHQNRKAFWVPQDDLHDWPPPADVCAELGVHLDRL